MEKTLQAGAARAGGREQDNVHLIVDCNPGVLDRNAALAGEGPSPGPELADMARGLEAAGADFLVMACNAAHAWQGDIEAAIRLPFVSIVEETARWLAAREAPGRPIGLMAAGACLESGLYQKALAAAGLRVVAPIPANLARFMQALYQFKAGGHRPRAPEPRCACAEQQALERGGRADHPRQSCLHRGPPVAGRRGPQGPPGRRHPDPRRARRGVCTATGDVSGERAGRRGDRGLGLGGQ